MTPEEFIVYIARVSNPANQQLMKNNEGLLRYCIKNAHWSIFEHFFLTFEIETNLNVATQILRHRSATFQQFSGRYQDVSVLDSFYDEQEYRMADETNRQHSIEIVDSDLTIEQKLKISEFKLRDKHLEDLSIQLYKDKLEFGLAKEVSRSHLLQLQKTKMYMSNNLRNILTYLMLRQDKSTQKEHRMVADAIYKMILPIFPTIFESLSKLNSQNK
jgi:thymidylate synthase (FAD)